MCFSFAWRSVYRHWGEVHFARCPLIGVHSIDNLDKAWGGKGNVSYLSDLIFGLFSVSRRITTEFQASGHWRRAVNLSIIVFIRADIFSSIRAFSREPDKLSHATIEWNDPELLLRVLDERLLSSVAETMTPDEIWNRFFVTDVGGVPVRDFIIQFTLKRPRNVIYLLQLAKGIAVNRGHARVDATDFLTARDDYSRFAFEALLAEDDPEIGQLENVLYEFVGMKNILSRNDVFECLRRVPLTEEYSTRYFERLVELNFLGFVLSDGAHEYPGDERRKQVLSRLIDRVPADEPGYVINPVYHAMLEVRG